MKTEKKRITLQQLLKDDLPVWVRNCTGEPGISKEPGTIALQVGSGTDVGKLFIPPGRDPICLTDQVDLTSLKTCRGLFKAISSGALELLDPEKAEEYYSVHENRKAKMQEKVDKYVNHKAMRPATKPDMSPVSVDKISATNTIKVHPKIGDMCLRARANALAETDMLETLFELEGVVTKDDLNHLLQNCSYSGVQKWAQEQFVNKDQKVDPIDG